MYSRKSLGGISRWLWYRQSMQFSFLIFRGLYWFLSSQCGTVFRKTRWRVPLHFWSSSMIPGPSVAAICSFFISSVNVVFYWKLYKNKKSYQSNSFPCQNSVVTSVEKGCWEHQSTEPGGSYSYGHLVILYVSGNWQPSSFRRSPSSRWISSCLQHKTEVLSLCHDI